MRKVSLLTSFISAFILFILVPIITISALLSNAYRETMLKSYNQQVSENLNQMNVAIEDELKRLSLSASVIANNRELMNRFEDFHEETDPSIRFDISLDIDQQLNYLFSFNSDINGVIIYFKDGNNYYYREGPAYGYDEVMKERWYDACIDNRGLVQIIGYGNNYTTNSSRPTLAVAISPTPITVQNSIKILYVDIFSPYLEEIQNDTQIDSRYILCSSDGNIIIDSMNELDDKNLSILFREGIDYLEHEPFINREIDEWYVSKTDLTRQQWHILYMERISSVDKDLSQLLMIFYLIYILVAVSFSIYILVFYRSSIRPVRMLEANMTMVQKGHLDVETEIGGPREIRALGESFNRMMARINHLIKERDTKEKERSAEEIKALQAQINPHFIYNTLNTIKLMAIMQNATTIREMLEAFMKVTALTFRKSGSHLSVLEEIEYIKAYVLIIQARYGSFIEVDYDVSDEAKDLFIMKMLLQPFMENAIIHGLHDCDDGRIQLKIEVDEGKLKVSIEDNGIGMDEEMIAKMLDGISNEEHIGMSNVKRRIKLTYGDNYTVNVVSEINHYTRVELILPVIKNLKEVNDENNYDS